MTPATVELQQYYRELRLPVVIITGADDQIADVGHQSERLHRELPDSEFIVVPGMGHMIHHLAPGEVVRAINRAAERVSAKAACGAWMCHEYRCRVCSLCRHVRQSIPRPAKIGA